MREKATQCALDIVEADQATQAVQQEIVAWARQHPTCPVCGGVVDPEQVLNQDHAHA
jgi:formamidopyrimidine-DNA glycosylase